MIQSVHIPIYCDKEENKAGALLTLKTVRVGFPTVPITVHASQTIPIATELQRACDKAGFCLTKFSGTNDSLIKWMVKENQDKPFAVIDSDVVFFENCEDFEPLGLIAGEYIPEFVCPIAKAVTQPRLHTAFFVVADPAKLRRAIDLAYRPVLSKFCPFDPFTPVVTFTEKTPVFHDSCSVLYHAVGGEHFQPDMLKRFEHLYGGSYVNGVHLDRIKAAYENPESARGVREMMTKYFEERKL